MQIRIARGFWTSRFGTAVLGAMLVVFLGAAGVLTYYYVQFGHLIDQRLTGQVFQNTSSVYSAPGHIFTGETMHASDLKSYLLQAGYQEGNASAALGQFRVNGSTVEIRPSANSYFHGANGLRVDFSGTEISHIAQLSDGTARDSAELEPLLITNLFDSTREKRRVLQFNDMPPLLVHSVLAAEDKRFFEHGALDLIRVFGAALADVRLGRKAQGASTIDMQVA
ncbi:MAG: transglycosylase domain-containing protein, partial [Candidatus Acidiferrales bacterium]